MKNYFIQFPALLMTVALMTLAEGAFSQGMPSEAERTAFMSCLRKYDLPLPGAGTPPEPEEFSKVKACMAAKGYSLPDLRGGPGAHPGPRPEVKDGSRGSEDWGSSDTSESSSSGASQE